MHEEKIWMFLCLLLGGWSHPKASQSAKADGIKCDCVNGIVFVVMLHEIFDWLDSIETQREVDDKYAENKDYHQIFGMLAGIWLSLTTTSFIIISTHTKNVA